MNLGWVARYRTEDGRASVHVVTRDATSPVDSVLSVHVGDDVEDASAEAQRRGYEIVHPLSREPWGAGRRVGLIGYCGLLIGDASEEEPEIAYELARRTHGNGYATEAARIVVAEAARTGRRRLWATVREWNTASFRVLEKLGFHDSGRITPDPDRGDTIWMTEDLTDGASPAVPDARLPTRRGASRRCAEGG
jgi:RimJ/RimL family protein N-acetyltransferase